MPRNPVSEPVDLDALGSSDPESRRRAAARFDAFTRVVDAQRAYDRALIRYARLKVAGAALLDLVTSGATTDGRRSARDVVDARRVWQEALIAYAHTEGIGPRAVAEVIMGGARVSWFDVHDELWLPRRR